MRTQHQSKRELDKIDRNILRILQNDGRISFTELGEKVGLSRRAVLKLPHVLECHLVSGDFDYLVKARISEMASYRKLLGDILLKLPHVRESKSYIVMEEVKESLCLSIPD